MSSIFSHVSASVKSLFRSLVDLSRSSGVGGVDDGVVNEMLGEAEGVSDVERRDGDGERDDGVECECDLLKEKMAGMDIEE